MVGFILRPLAVAAPTSEDFARRLDMPISAVPSMMAAMPVVEPSAAMSNVVPGCCDLNCSANCGTSFAPNVSDPLMTRRSACALETLAARIMLNARYFVLMIFGGFARCEMSIFQNLTFRSATNHWY